MFVCVCKCVYMNILYIRLKSLIMQEFNLGLKKEKRK